MFALSLSLLLMKINYNEKNKNNNRLFCPAFPPQPPAHRNNNHIRAAPTLRGYRRQVDTTVTVDEETGAGAADVVPFYRHASYYQHYSTFSPTATKYGACGGDSMLPPSLANGTATSQPQHCLACMSQLTGKPSPLSNKAQHILVTLSLTTMNPLINPTAVTGFGKWKKLPIEPFSISPIRDF